MRQRLRLPALIPLTLALLVALALPAAAQYEITVTQDRLINAQNEPQNWLLPYERRTTVHNAIPSLNADQSQTTSPTCARSSSSHSIGGMQDGEPHRRAADELRIDSGGRRRLHVRAATAGATVIQDRRAQPGTRGQYDLDPPTPSVEARAATDARTSGMALLGGQGTSITTCRTGG